MVSSPYRTLAKPEPESPAPEEPYAATLRALTWFERIGVAGALLAIPTVIAGVVFVRAAHPARSRAEEARAAEAARIASVRSVLDTVKGRADREQTRLSAVIVALADHDTTETAAGACETLATPTRRSFPLVTISRDDAARGHVPSPSILAIRADMKRAEEHLTRGRIDAAMLVARALQRTSLLQVDVVLVAHRETKPVATSSSSYIPGEVEGRAYVYDFEAGRVVCAGDVRASSSREIGYAYATASDAPTWLGKAASHSASLDADLRRATEKAVASSMQALTMR